MVQKVDKHSLHRPSLEEVAKALSDGLRSNFEHVQVDVVDCPDLRQKPFMLASEGICGQPRLTDIGGVPYLVPIAQTDKVRVDLSLQDPERKHLSYFFLSAGKMHTVSVHLRQIYLCILSYQSTGKPFFFIYWCNSFVQDGSCVLGNLSGPCCEFCLMGNFLISEGKQGKVIKVSAKKRTGQENFVTAMRNGLKAKYGTEPVGMGGAFLLAQGKAKLHIMPKFSTAPLLTDAAMNQWLKFFEMNAPLVCLSTFVSHDPGWDLRIEHTHCFSDHKQGGHYHYDTTPDEVEYLGYFNVAEWLYRIDAPVSTHKIGRD
ncbi:conserved hypothetical protein [Ixodes scapularis]|uniref:DUF1907 domain-containing protein n=1 Tax=Ixodes scapularis TaxID=6945 RepID=B7Q5H2_IXOSC|nr:conserved hypothetical protein [Ixodes scapularis]|eukprot:XP_002401937.1 conserved hypothetical protein [Ixodes scapularis]